MLMHHELSMYELTENVPYSVYIDVVRIPGRHMYFLLRRITSGH